MRHYSTCNTLQCFYSSGQFEKGKWSLKGQLQYLAHKTFLFKFNFHKRFLFLTKWRLFDVFESTGTTSTSVWTSRKLPKHNDGHPSAGWTSTRSLETSRKVGQVRPDLYPEATDSLQSLSSSFSQHSKAELFKALTFGWEASFVRQWGTKLVPQTKCIYWLGFV